MSKFGFFTDCHLTNRHIRIDDIRDSVLNKLNQIYTFASQQNFDFMVFGGDFFHSEKVVDLKIFITVCDILKRFGKKTYFIVGNHDVYGNSLNYYKQSSLNFIATLIPQLFVPIFDPIQLKDVVLYGCHSYNDLNYTIQHIEKNNEKIQVLIDHHMVYDKKIPSTSIIYPKELGSNNLDLILTGHVHMGYEQQTYGNTTYLNPGSLTRTSSDLKNLKVKMAIIDIAGKNFKISYYYPNILQGDLIFKQNIFSGIQKIAKLQKLNEETQVIQSLKHFQQLKESSSNIFELLNKLAVQNNVQKSVVDYINKFSSKIN